MYGSVLVFDGKKSSLERTIAIFRQAKVVVAYHGGATANLVFASRARPTCMVEYTTFFDLKSHGRWREFCDFVPNGGWSLQLPQLQPRP